MTCRHSPHDPSCGSYASKLEEAQQFIVDRAKIEGKTATPDAENYEIMDLQDVGPNLVLRVKYPSCVACAYEGEKVMVFLDTHFKATLKWKRIDPHFRNPKAPRLKTEAPPPDARFPASDNGWRDAIEWARIKWQEAT